MKNLMLRSRGSALPVVKQQPLSAEANLGIETVSLR